MVDTLAVIANSLATSHTGLLEDTDDGSAAND